MPVEQQPPSSAGQHAPPPPLVSLQVKPSGQVPSAPGVQSITHSCSSPTAAQLPDWHSVPIAQATPFASFVHAPAPSQLSAPAHSFAGSCMLGMFAHVPAEPATLHAMQRPQQVVLRGTLVGIAEQLHEAAITKTAVIIVGDVLAAEGFTDSYLYSSGRNRGSGH